MTVRHEIKSQLAKLLATEDLVVENKNVETACFNVHTRVLTLPNWDKAGNEIYDMLVAHEVGHALYTPDRDWIKEYKIPPQFVNVVEDVRIEKLMKRKYPGLHKSFNGGYEELAEQDFFNIENEDIESMNLADRINLYFKIGKFVDISFNTDEERRIVKLVGDAETFSDAIASLTCVGVKDDNIVLAVLVPIPLTEINKRKISLSAKDEKPYNVCASSLTCKCV